MSSYNKLAAIYDQLAQLVFWGRINRANSLFLSQIPANSKVLIIGGGTGKSLKHLNPELELDYAELSSAMINKAKKRKGPKKTEFILGFFQEFKTQKKYDYVVCPFFLDQFNSTEINPILTSILSVLPKGGHLLVSDFNRPKKPMRWLKQLIIKTTILFFRITTGLRINKLEDISSILEKNKFQKTSEKQFYFGMIFSSKWIIAGH
jgi:ubiquinone/menaquinone biosynthesis C-methylase UbiE